MGKHDVIYHALLTAPFFPSMTHARGRRKTAFPAEQACHTRKECWRVWVTHIVNKLRHL